ncbi:heparinase II/III domain-containing protein [Peloplasma aerotolerans]|uniref:Heparinase II/III family protein n=1 Tax=Peloplasma aerotolerans TaxID=3044389 RepID=A0AAW6U737_9MOLU|nr:heparinase II/III family protein [Mariniplasma sp. M4Ah]MDI6452384.1 heparinase II/III family protein [Mariniplasma sp. M4Ah]
MSKLAISRIHKFLTKYGVLSGPFHLIKWWKTKRQFSKYAIFFSNLNFQNVKITQKKINFNKFYTGQITEETSQILNGKRQILFYNENDNIKNVDAKNKWELNRFQHICILALNNSNFKVTDYINQEIQSNMDVLTGTNAMEVSISLINFITYFQISSSENNINIEIVLKFMVKAMNYILKNIEIGIKYSSNHYFFNLLGILWYLENTEYNEKLANLKKISYKELVKFLDKSILEDGSYFEGSTYYHKYINESLMLFMVFNKDSNMYNLLMKYSEKLFRFTKYSSMNDQLIGIGDNDSGRLFALPQYFNYSSTNLELIYRLATELGISTDYSYSSFSNNPKLLNKNNMQSFGLLKLENEKWSIAIRASNATSRTSTKIVNCHFHNDQFSIIANYKNIPLFIEKGTYSYVSDNQFRKVNMETKAHNSLFIKGIEPNLITNDWRCFARLDKAVIRVFDSTKAMLEHNDYKEFTHQREIEINHSFIIKDRVIYAENATIADIYLQFYLHPSTTVDVVDKNVIILNLNNLYNIRFKSANNSIISLSESTVSTEYGCIQKTLLISVKLNKVDVEKHMDNLIFVEVI